MWIFTRDGFFSIAATPFCKPGDVAVRCRRRDHLVKLMSRHGLETEILCVDNSDYKYRIQIPRDLWAGILRDEAAGIDYASFKDSLVAANADSDYLRAMFTTWSVLHKMQTSALEPEDD